MFDNFNVEQKMYPRVFYWVASPNWETKVLYPRSSFQFIKVCLLLTIKSKRLLANFKNCSSFKNMHKNLDMSQVNFLKDETLWQWFLQVELSTTEYWKAFKGQIRITIMQDLRLLKIRLVKNNPYPKLGSR